MNNISFRFIILMIFTVSACNNKTSKELEQESRLKSYVSECNAVNDIFNSQDVKESIQPELTHTELGMLDALADELDSTVSREFDTKCRKWMSCWVFLTNEAIISDPQYALRCNGREYDELLNFCRKQDERIVILFYQLAARANCPYDRFLMRPVLDLASSFPNHRQYWDEISKSLQTSKDHERITCKEATIWQIRKMFEAQYRYTFNDRLLNLFNSRGLLMVD